MIMIVFRRVLSKDRKSIRWQYKRFHSVAFSVATVVGTKLGVGVTFVPFIGEPAYLPGNLDLSQKL